MAANGSRLLATTWGDTLSILRRDDGVVLASEPYDDDPGWEDVPDRHLVEVTAEGVTMTALNSNRRDLDDTVAVQPPGRGLGVSGVAP